MAILAPRVFFDTSVLVSALVANHPRHDEAAERLERAHAGEIQLIISTHAIAELYSTLSALPVSPRISPKEALALIREDVLSCAEVVSLEAADYEAVISDAAEMDVSGGAVYDALHVKAARKGAADRLWTMNERDFIRLWPDHDGIIEGVYASGS